jgi:hypothetical protein
VRELSFATTHANEIYIQDSSQCYALAGAGADADNSNAGSVNGFQWSWFNNLDGQSFLRHIQQLVLTLPCELQVIGEAAAQSGSFEAIESMIESIRGNRAKNEIVYNRGAVVLKEQISALGGAIEALSKSSGNLCVFS